MEENLKISYSNLDDQTIFYKSLKWRRPPVEEDLRCKKKTSKHVECYLWDFRGKVEENAVEISSVALLSPACYYFKQ